MTKERAVGRSLWDIGTAHSAPCRERLLQSPCYCAAGSRAFRRRMRDIWWFRLPLLANRVGCDSGYLARVPPPHLLGFVLCTLGLLPWPLLSLTPTPAVGSHFVQMSLQISAAQINTKSAFISLARPISSASLQGWQGGSNPSLRPRIAALGMA